MNAQTKHDDDDMPAEIDFSGARRGQFYQAGAQLNLPVYLEQQVQATLAALAFWLRIDSVALLGAIFFVAGLYVAVQEALESTVTADMVSRDTLTISYGVLGTVNGTAKLISSTAVGVLWTLVSSVFGFGLAAGLMAAGTVVLVRLRTG